jgi:predicted ABC-type ATPase
MHPILDARPLIVALAGPNGAGKSTFFEAHLQASGLRFINADDFARRLGIGRSQAAELATALRIELVKQRESFIFETVFSDPVGDKLHFLKDVVAIDYAALLIYIGLSDAAISEERVAMRVSQGGHDVRSEKIQSRFSRTLVNLKRAIKELPLVLIYDNSDLQRPFRKVAEYGNGQPLFVAQPLPEWFAPLL